MTPRAERFDDDLSKAVSSAQDEQSLRCVYLIKCVDLGGQERPAETSSVEHCSRSGSSVVRPLKAPVYQDNGCESSLAAKLESVPNFC